MSVVRLLVYDSRYRLLLPISETPDGAGEQYRSDHIVLAAVLPTTRRVALLVAMPRATSIGAGEHALSAGNRALRLRVHVG